MTFAFIDGFSEPGNIECGDGICLLSSSHKAVVNELLQ